MRLIFSASFSKPDLNFFFKSHLRVLNLYCTVWKALGLMCIYPQGCGVNLYTFPKKPVIYTWVFIWDIRVNREKRKWLVAESFEQHRNASLEKQEAEKEDSGRTRLLEDSAFVKPTEKLALAAKQLHALDERWPMPRGSVLQPLNLELSEEEKQRIGKKVWMNESGGTKEGLTAWNKGEEFPSLGIGHFIWMPRGVHTPFGDSFPEAMKFVKEHGGELPKWLDLDEPCPWDTRSEFMKEFNGKKLTELRDALEKTVPQQTDFLVYRLENALPGILQKIDDPAQRAKIQERFYRVLNSGPPGVFALVDYVNFKGEGLEPVPQYHNKSWGLKQVLEGMKDTDNPVKDFSDSAKEVLKVRVDNSPPARNEKQWLKGWLARVDRYVSDPPLLPRHRHHH